MRLAVPGFLALSACVHAGEPSPSAAEPPAQSEFVGRYDGSSFETAMGMEIRADGTFGWGVSVGALDMRASGSWEQRGETIVFASDPRPIAPEFGVSGLEEVENAPWIKVVWASNGEPFQYASAIITCKNGEMIGDQVYAEGWPPPDRNTDGETPPERALPEAECDEPETVTLSLSMYDVHSERYVLRDLGWEPGMTVRFEFRRNDLGIADFTGVTGTLDNGILKLRGARWPLELRKLPPSPKPDD